MSDPSPLSFPDYHQVFSDHRRFLVLVRSISPATLRPKNFARVFEVLDRCHAKVTVNSADDRTRHIEVRFVRNYPVESNEWGDFQHHRAVLGLVSVGSYKNHQEHAELSRLHDSLKGKYSKSLLCSRLIALKDDANHEQKEAPDLSPDENRSPFRNNQDHMQPPMSPRLSSTNSPHGKLDYSQETLDERELENDISAFLTTLFWMLEKTRVEKLALDASGKVPLLCAPFEKRDFVGLDLESRVNKRRTVGRFKKHLGDISLICGMFKEALDFYEKATEILTSCNDWLWLANSMEGSCAISAIVHYPSVNRTNSLKRNSSFQTVSNAIYQKRKEKSVLEIDDLLRKRVLTPRSLIEALREIVVHYSKYRHAGVMETEVSIKAVQVLIEQGDILFAAEFLQNIVFINLQMTDEEKVARFSALSKLYTRLNFQRKAAFFHRVAAMRCVAPQNPHTDWSQCYQLMMKTLPGYNISFQNISPNSSSSMVSGWPPIQIKILQELVGTARRMGDQAVAIRHMAFILQNLFESLNDQERCDLAQQLTLLTSKSPGTPVHQHHSVEGGAILPPVNIYTIPRITGFKPTPLVEPLVAPTGGSSGNDGPFIWTPIQVDSAKKKSLFWVQNEVSSVEITVINPLPVELKISNICLMTEGAGFDAFPSSFILSPRTGPVQLKLSGVPLEPGLLNILGYSCIVFGVKSNCRLKSLSIAELNDDRILIEVCPSIPRLELTVMNEDNKIIKSGREAFGIDLFHGEQTKFKLNLLNASNLKVECLTLDLKTTPMRYKKFIKIATEVTELIEPGETLEVGVQVMSPETQCRYHELERLDECAEVSGDLESLKRESFLLNVVVKYSSDPESSKGYCRQLIQKVDIKLIPSVVVTWWDILPGESANECYVVLDLRNLTDYEAELRYGSGKRIIIDAKGTCRIPLPLEKIECPSERNEIDKQKFLANYLDAKVDLRWDLISFERTGQISLSDIRFNTDMISRLERSAVAWTVSLNDQRWLGMDYSFGSGEPIVIEVSMINKYKTSIQCAFHCESHYVIEGSDIPLNLRKIPVSGSKVLWNCDPDETVINIAYLLPCNPGRISIKCICDVYKTNSEEKIDQIQIPSIYVNVS